MSNNWYDVNYSAIPCGMGTDTITLDNTLLAGGAMPATYTYTTNSTGVNTGPYINSTVNIDADGLTMKQGADIKIGGKSLTQAIEKIEQRLGILNPNPELESRWDQLKELREQYVEMERDLLEKEKLMKILKAA